MHNERNLLIARPSSIEGPAHIDIIVETFTPAHYAKRLERDTRNQGWGSTEAGKQLAKRYLTKAITAIELAACTIDTSKLPVDFLRLDTSLMALIALQGVLDTAVKGGDKRPTRANTQFAIGKLAEMEAYKLLALQVDPKAFKEAEKKARERRCTVSARRSAITKALPEVRKLWRPWTGAQKQHVANFLVEATLGIGLFVDVHLEVIEGKRKVAQRFLELTEEAKSELGSIIEMVFEQHTFHFPVTSMPEPWTSPRQLINDAPVALISGPWRNDARVQKAINSGTMNKPVEALNIAQSVPYRINTFVLETVQACFERGIDVDGVPVQIEGDKENERERDALRFDLGVARQFAGVPFYTPMKFDYRGRMYPVSRFHFQRSDAVRAMFEFHRGEVLNADGLRFLMIHLANCGDFKLADGSKISKKSFAARVAWVESNHDAILNYAESPLETVEAWKKADVPFMFIAACRAYADALAGLPVHLPVGFDGSNNGVQHLTAMTRDPAGALVNLTPSDEPQDIYNTVANAVRKSIKAELKQKVNRRLPAKELKVAMDRQKAALDAVAHGIDRSLVKRATMTIGYGSKAGGFDKDGEPFGMTKQYMVDHMLKLGKKHKVHPFGETKAEWKHAAYFLADHTYKACVAVLGKPLEAMDTLQALARACAKEQKPMVWHTPLGFEVVLECPEVDDTQISLSTHDGKFRPRVRDEFEGTINSREAANASAPGFVHALDSCHLQMVVLACADEGIELALVHDSFSCHPNRAARLRTILVEQFHKLHSADVLGDVVVEVIGSLESKKVKTNVPSKGSLDIEMVLQSQYAFA